MDAAHLAVTRQAGPKTVGEDANGRNSSGIVRWRPHLRLMSNWCARIDEFSQIGLKCDVVFLGIRHRKVQQGVSRFAGRKAPSSLRGKLMKNRHNRSGVEP